VGPRAQPDRYEPLPGILEIPGFLLRKLGPRGRRLAAVVGAVLAAAIVVGLVVGIPAIVHAKRESAAADARQAARQRSARVAELRREVRPVHGRGPAAHGLAAPATLAAQRALRAGLVATMTADAARRAHTGEFALAPRRVDCERSPVTAGSTDPAATPQAGRARYACLAVTADIGRSAATHGGTVGYPYLAVVDFPAGRFAFCKVSGRPGEMLIGRDVHVAVPAACGGR